MGYRKYKCSECNSGNVTPTNRKELTNFAVCQYVCEECGYISKEMIYWETDVPMKNNELKGE